MVTHLVPPLKLNIVTAPQDHGKNHRATSHGFSANLARAGSTLFVLA